MCSLCVTLSSSSSLSSLSEFVPGHHLAIPFLSRSTILRSPLDIFLLCREFKFSWSTRIHPTSVPSLPLIFFVLTPPRVAPLSYTFDPLDSAASVILMYIHCVRSSSSMIRDFKPLLLLLISCQLFVRHVRDPGWGFNLPSVTSSVLHQS